MDYSREIYWNVGSSAAVLVPMYLLTAGALVALVYGYWKRINLYRQGRKLNRTDQLGLRLFALMRGVLLQDRVMRVKGPGGAHALFFWGFFLLFIGTCLIVVQVDFTVPLFGVQFLTGRVYQLFSLVLDLAGLVAVIMLGGLLVRRYVVRPKGLESKAGDLWMHGSLLAILFTGFGIEGARMAVTELGSSLATWSPVGMVVAKGLAGFDESTLRALHKGAWWLHLLLVAGFILSIPFTKLRHLLTTSGSYFFIDLGPKGKLETLDLEDEDVETFGAAKPADLTWKDIYDADACMLCKRCQDRCPAHNTDKPLSPMKVINQIGEAAFATPDADLIEKISKDALWSCTTCLACQEICPANIEHVVKIVEIRRNLVLMDGDFPGEEVRAAIEQVEVNGNPWGIGYAARGDWAQELGVKPLAEDTEVDILYFVGCYASFDKRNQGVAKAFIKLCQSAGVKVGILGKEERCCGEPVRKIGNEYLYQAVAAENIKLLKGYGIKQVVTSCPHCFNTLAKDYRDLGFEIPVEHYTVFLEKLLRLGRLPLSSGKTLTCTYHDSCYLGRYNELYEAPRALLEAAGVKLSEMASNRAESFCCGAGGGRILAEEHLGTRISAKRLKMAAATAALTLVSSCPFCLTMFEDGVKTEELESRLVPKDVVEILIEGMKA